MRKKQTGRRRRAPYLFMITAAILLFALVFVAVRAMNTWDLYEKEAAVTPVPTPTVRPMNVTPDPGLITYTPQPTATPSVLSNGSSGEMVVQLQKRLQELGFYSGSVDGQFGSGTKKAVQLFQKQHGLDADGAAGQKTLSVLYSDQAKQIVITPTPEPVNILAGELPVLVNADHPLPEDFEPGDLVRVRDVTGDLMTYADDGIRGVREAAEALAVMIRAAKEDGISPWKLREGYRTISDQQRIFNNYVEKYITENDLSRSRAVSATRQTVADPGCSEHHTGLAFDLNVEGEFFADTAQYVWLQKHCWEYGFIMRYTDEKQEITGILGEEWHVRYVGKEHSLRMRDLDMCLEEYIAYLEQQ